MKKHFVFGMIWVGFVLPALACGNEYEFYRPGYSYTQSNGTMKYFDYALTGYHFHHGFDKKELYEKKRELEKLLKKEKKYQYLSDYALVLLKLGEHKKSLSILQNLVKDHPNEYNIVANLGTAYELNGKPDSALKYIQLGVKLNPDSHDGSEWIHVKILDAKLKMEKYPDYLKEHSIVGLSLNLRKDYTEEEIARYLEIRDQLAWQLEERIRFVKEPDPVVASLLYDLANLVAVTEVLENAVPLYDLSIKYQPQNLGEVLAARDEVQSIIRWARVKKYTLWIFIFLVLASGAVLFFVSLFKGRKRRRMNGQVPVVTSAHLSNEP